MVLRHVKHLRFDDCIKLGGIAYKVEESNGAAFNTVGLVLSLVAMPGKAAITLHADDLVELVEMKTLRHIEG